MALLISDAASYMVKVGQTLKTVYLQMSHILCIAHLLHKGVMKIIFPPRGGQFDSDCQSPDCKKISNRSVIDSTGQRPGVILNCSESLPRIKIGKGENF